MANPPISIEYTAWPTLSQFHASDEFVRGVKGPIGSGKSSAMVMELMTRSMRQKPFNKVRYTKHAVVRRTFAELRDTTIKTWKMWVPDSVCHISETAPYIGKAIYPLSDGTTVNMEVLFLALDGDEDADKLKSNDLTMVWINEAHEITEENFIAARSRVGRFPPVKYGGPTFEGVIMDTNPPHDKHWWYKFAEVEKPKGMRFWSQPPGLLASKDSLGNWEYRTNVGQGRFPAAENLSKLSLDYYLRQTHGTSHEWIRVNLMNEYATQLSGKPVWPEYSDTTHVASAPIPFLPGLPLVVAMDLGLTPAAVFMQMTPNGIVHVIDEVWADSMGVRRFARDILLPKVRNEFAGADTIFVIDPAGIQRTQSGDEQTYLDILAEEGIHAELASTNLFPARREAVAFFLMQMREGRPSFQLAPKCKRLRDGMRGGYHFKNVQTSDGMISSARPEKNEYSHVCDALEYGCLLLRQGYISRSSDPFYQASQEAGRGHALPVKVLSSLGWA